MPFEQVFPRSFNPTGVIEYAPARGGVYGLSNSREWVFIGNSDDIRRTLMQYLETPGLELMRRKPTGFVFELCGVERRLARQTRLILEYKPVCR
jgi:hypothetical protein